MKKTKKQFEEYLNQIMPEEEFWMGGKCRLGKYGTSMRKHDPIQFEWAYSEWCRYN